jgi:ketosteroid isomerase-like protein
MADACIEDHVAIQRLMYAYARCADNKDYDGFADLFCADAVFVYRGENVTPLTAIQQMMQNLEKYRVTQHSVHNVLYEVDGDVARGQTYCLAAHLVDGDGVVDKIDMGIIYDDRLLRTGDGWRIQRRVFNLLWMQTTHVDAV